MLSAMEVCFSLRLLDKVNVLSVCVGGAVVLELSWVLEGGWGEQWF